MNEIQTLPTPKNFGLGFNYALWTPGTTVTLCNVPWNSDYRDIVRFDNQAALDSYLLNDSGPTINITKLSYARVGQPIKIDLPFNAAYKYNYIRVFNPSQPVAGDEPRAFYYFIQDVVSISPNNTVIYVQLDLWQTFGYGVTFGRCYIEQGHIGIANVDQFSDNGKDYLTVQEGLDVGNEYDIHKQYQLSAGSAREKIANGQIENYSVLVTTATALDVDPGNADNPTLHSAKGSGMENLPNGAEIYLFNSLGHFKAFMEAMSDKPWVTQGIMSVMAVPRLDRYQVQLESTYVGGDVNVPIDKVSSAPLINKRNIMAPNWRDEIWNATTQRYRNLKKFLVYPYTVIEMTSYTGTPLVLKPECWADPNGTVFEIPHFAPPSARLSFLPYRYNARASSPETIDELGTVNDGGEFLNMTTGIFDFPTFSVVNNGYMQFLAANRNGIAYQHSSANWSQTKALAGNSTAYDQASNSMATTADITNRGISAAGQSTNIANDAQSAHMIINGAAGVARGAIMGAAGGPVGVLAGAGINAGEWAVGALNNAVDVNARNAQLGVSNSLAAGNANSAISNAGYIRDTNKDLADYSARGDYQNQIAGIQARVQDAALTQPTTSGQIGGDAFLLSQYKWGVDLKIKRIQTGVMIAIGEYWLRYGYAINRFSVMPASFMVMEKFTYWKLRETYITGGACPEPFKQAIRGIFEKGVTVWKNPAHIGNTDLGDNNPLPGVRI